MRAGLVTHKLRLRAVTLVAAFALEAAVLAPPADGAAPKPSLDIASQVDHSEITIGDRVHYEIKVVYPARGRIEMPSVLGNLGAFEVKDYQASEPKLADNLKIQTWRFDLSTFTVGKYMIPPQQVVYIPEESGKPRSNDSVTVTDSLLPAGSAVFYTQPIEINVVRTSPETVKDIADIAPLAPIAASRPWGAYGLGAALALGLGLWLLLRRRRALAPVEKPLLPPYEEAMESLAALNAATLVRQNRARELCFALSEVLRRYISRRYEVDALEATTTEFLALARKLPITSAQKDWLRAFCDATDLVKFAGAPMLESEAETLLQREKEFLAQTKPREDAVTDAARAPAGAKP